MKTEFKESFPRERTKVEELIEDIRYPEERRTYLGASLLGHSCNRYIWYSFRWWNATGTITARQKRLFQRGHREEPIIIEDLKKIGIKIHSTQNQVTLAQGHISGHNDGIISNVPDAPKTKHILECKTSATVYFKNLAKSKSVKLTFHEYWVQCILYMHMFGIKRCLFIMVNKNNDDRYYERIKVEPKQAKFYLQKGVDLINAVVPPKRIKEEMFYKCNWCKFKAHCREGQSPDKNCRTCKHSEPADKGSWLCRKRKEKISKKRMQKGCKKYLVLC